MMSIEGWARKNPLTPPLMNIEINPSANSEARVDPQVRAVEAADPDQHHDRRRDRDDQRREGKRQRRERIHAADEHVVAVHHVAEDGQRAHGVDQRRDGSASARRMLVTRTCETMPMPGTMAMYTSGCPKNQNRCCQSSVEPPECGCN